jgi:hypothetical protein
MIAGITGRLFAENLVGARLSSCKARFGAEPGRLIFYKILAIIGKSD